MSFPAKPFFGGGLKPRFALAPFDAGDKFGPVGIGRATERDTLPLMLLQPCLKGRIYYSGCQRLPDAFRVQREGHAQSQQAAVRFYGVSGQMHGAGKVPSKPTPAG